eukprot:COSAG05_NODE_2169_length_3442_cov_5.100808_1_plen_510_part_00
MLQLAVAGSTRQHAHSREPLSCLRQRRSAAGSTELCRHLGCSSATAPGMPGLGWQPDEMQELERSDVRSISSDFIDDFIDANEPVGQPSKRQQKRPEPAIKRQPDPEQKGNEPHAKWQPGAGNFFGFKPEKVGGEDALSIVTLNCYIGQPMPLPWRAAPLQGSRSNPNGRLNNQLRRLHDISPDVLCLQEVHTVELCKIYSRFFQDTHEAFYSTAPAGDEDHASACWILSVGVAIAVLAVISAIGAAVLSLGCSLLGVRVAGPGYTLAAAAHIAGWFVLLRESPWLCFLLGTTSPTQITLWRRDKLQCVEARATLFSQQEGDWMNVLRPRGYLSVQLERVDNGCTFWVINAHTNAFPTVPREAGQLCPSMMPIECQLREAQSLELTKHARSLRAMSERSGKAIEANSVLLVGDFNATPELAEYKQIIASGLLDSFLLAGVGRRNTWAHTQNSLCHTGAFTGEDCVMDYIFVLPSAHHKLLCKQCEVVCNQPPWVSDHFAVRLLFQLALK